MKEKRQVHFPYDIAVFLIFFPIYFICGYQVTCMSEAASTIDVFFFSDTARVFSDLSDTLRINNLLVTEINHYRSLVHPTFMPFFYPIVGYLNLFFGNFPLSIVFLQSILGSINVFLILRILKKLELDILWQLLLSGLYGFSFTQFVFTMQPETFLYAATGLLLFWHFVISRASNSRPLSQWDYVFLVFCGVFCLGITVTNYMQFGIGLAYLLMVKEKSIKKAIKSYIPLILISFSFTVVINNIQIGLWRNSGNFMVYITDFLINPNNDEKTYISMAFTVTHVLNIIKSFFMHNFVSPSIHFTDAFELGAYPAAVKIFFVVQGIFLFPLIFLSLEKNKKHLSLAAVLCFTLFLNGLLHIFYGNDELFLYTQHFTFLVILILALCLKGTKGAVKGILSFAVSIFIIYEIVCNLSAAAFIVDITQQAYPSGGWYLSKIGGPWTGLIKSFCVIAFYYALFVLSRRFYRKVNLAGKGFLWIFICFLAIIVPTGLKLHRDQNVIQRITTDSQFAENGAGYQVYHCNNQILYVFENTAGASSIKEGHVLVVELLDGVIYERAGINFNKSPGYRLFSRDLANSYYLIEIYSPGYSNVITSIN